MFVYLYRTTSQYLKSSCLLQCFCILSFKYPQNPLFLSFISWGNCETLLSIIFIIEKIGTVKIIVHFAEISLLLLFHFNNYLVHWSCLSPLRRTRYRIKTISISSPENSLQLYYCARVDCHNRLETNNLVFEFHLHVRTPGQSFRAMEDDSIYLYVYL